MGFVASIETDVGDELRLLHSDGQLGGKALLAFLTALGAICPRINDYDVRAWFERLEAHTERPICSLTASLIGAWYTGDWDYRDDEYAFFQHRSPQMPLTEQDFKHTLNQVAERWADIEQVRTTTDGLREALRAAQLEETWWYHPVWTLRDLDALTQTFRVAAERYAKRVRIRFV
jgi:hypothetical protein